MNRIKTYEKFVIQKNEVSYKEELILSLYETLSNLEKIELPKYFLKECLINESVIKTLSEKGKNILQKLANTASNVISFLTNIKKELSKHITDVLTKSKELIKTKLSQDKNFLDAIKKELNADRNAFLHDVKTCKEVSDFYTTKFKECIINNVMETLKKFLTQKQSIKESLDFNVIDNLVKHLHKIPPYAWLDMLHHSGTHGAEHLVNGLSYITKHLGGPEFKLPVISSLFGIAFEYNIKGLIKHGLIEAAEIFSVPFVGLVIKTAGNVATFLAAYELCREMSTDVEHFNTAAHH